MNPSLHAYAMTWPFLGPVQTCLTEKEHDRLVQRARDFAPVQRLLHRVAEDLTAGVRYETPLGKMARTYHGQPCPDFEVRLG